MAASLSQDARGKNVGVVVKAVAALHRVQLRSGDDVGSSGGDSRARHDV